MALSLFSFFLESYAYLDMDGSVHAKNLRSVHSLYLW